MSDKTEPGVGEMHYDKSILELIGETPLVRLNSIASGVPPLLLAKMEMLNPGGSVKDRIGPAMIEYCEKRGLLRPGGTIVEPTSGNTGHGLAIAAAIKGYHCIFVMTDKVSEEKRSLLRAYGAEVVICPSSVTHDYRNTIKMSLTGWPRRSQEHIVPTSTPILPTRPATMLPLARKYGAIRQDVSRHSWPVSALEARSPVRPASLKKRIHRSRSLGPIPQALSTPAILQGLTKLRVLAWRFFRLIMMLR